jgi:uracil DNA glycosylase
MIFALWGEKKKSKNSHVTREKKKVYELLRPSPEHEIKHFTEKVNYCIIRGNSKKKKRKH